ncbi:hypothetical protein [Amycolatopsis sp. cmx-11-12]|uniref:hypothetical protein n=1 Tax=Amycolatopsis sp. cmx-11-12 TaxID=2785795 RepID=UPI003917514F
MFDVDEFLAGPLTARVAAAGPTVRPTWYLWEKQAFSDPHRTVGEAGRSRPRIAVDRGDRRRL